MSPDGLTVYAAVFHSGNKTTTVSEGALPTPAPLPTLSGLPAPQVGVMLQQVGPTTWRDVNGSDHNGLVRFSLPDQDVFAIDADATLLDASAITSSVTSVGTILFNMVVHPLNGTIYVSNTDANNMDRFEGSGATSLRGELHRAQISLISGGVAQPRRLNPHIVYTNLTPAQDVNDRSLAMPTDMAISSDGSTLYVAAFGSRKIGIVDTAALALAPGSPGAFAPDTADHVELSAGGPGGVALDEPRSRLYVLTRFDNAISIVDTAARAEIAHLPIHSPEVASITVGRQIFYDARFSSSNGEAACASCHIFGDFDSIAWDLGDPASSVVLNNNPFVKLNAPLQSFGLTGPTLNFLQPGSVVAGNLDFHPLKGPMTTQTLRGMDHGGPMHWRGDRSGGTAQNPWAYDGTPGALDETLAFQAFNPAFVGLLGRQTTIPAGDMKAFTDFILQVQLPPNPIRNLDLALTRRSAGRDELLRRSDLRHAQDLQRLPHAEPGGGVLRHRGALDLRGRDAALQGRAPAQRLSEGRHVRAGEQRRGSERAADPRLRLPARRIGRDGPLVPAVAGVPVPRRRRAAHAGRPADARVRHRSRARRRPADHAHGRELRESRRRLPTEPARRARRHELRRSGSPREQGVRPGREGPDRGRAARLVDELAVRVHARRGRRGDDLRREPAASGADTPARS